MVLVMDQTKRIETKALAARNARLAQVSAYLKTNGLGLAAEIAVNFVAPYLVYGWAKPMWGDVGALMASSAPPIAWSLVEFARHRRVDAISVLVLSGIALSLLAYLGGGGVHMLQLREKLVSGLIGLVFIASAAIRRPIIYELLRATLMRRGSASLAEIEARKNDQGFKNTMTIMTLVWGFGLLAEAAVGGILVFTISVKQFPIVGPLLGNGVSAALAAWSFWFGSRRRRLGDARRAAAAAASLQA